MENLDLSIVLPAYNESENLPDVLNNLKKVLARAKIRAEIIVVDNGSTDGTGVVLESLKKEIKELKTLRIGKNIGWGNGIIKGLEIARGPILGFSVADGQITPESIINIYLKLKSGNFDLCKGVRVERQDGLVRLMISKIYNSIFRLILQFPYKDINGVPKIFTRNFYKVVKLQSRDSFIDPEIFIKARLNNFSVGEVPIISLDRKRGRSTVSVLTMLAFLKGLFCWLLFKKFI